MKSALVLACDDRFIPFTAVVARRIARYAADKFPIVVVSDGVTGENKALAQKFCPEIGFIEAGRFLEGLALPVDETITRAAHLRLFLDEILADFDRAIYLDSDISPLADVSALLAIEPRSAPVVAAYDLHLTVDMSYRDRLDMEGPYFNSGVLALDLKAIRAGGIFDQARRYAIIHADRCRMHDQDALNAVLDGNWQVLDWRWNAMNYLSNLMPEQAFIRHFSGCKPWARKKIGVERRYVAQWRSDLAESPWPGRFREETVGHRIKRIFDPLTSGLDRFHKSRSYADAPGKRGNRARLINGLPGILSAIEEQAAAGAAARLPAFIR
jgi:lipopolysaccharide biosynthesis glycosyltransferase